MPRPKRPSPSMAVALLALFVALGGTAVAAKVLITSTSQIKNGVIVKEDLAPGAVNSGRIADGAVRAQDLNGQLQRVVGAEALEAVRAAGPDDAPANETTTVATLRNIPPGAYAFFAKTTLTAPSQGNGVLDPGETLGAQCVLDVEGDTDGARALLGGPGANAPGTLNLQLTRALQDPGSAQLRCSVSNRPWQANDTSIIAIPVAAGPRQTVTG
jgi:hypothetical protein